MYMHIYIYMYICMCIQRPLLCISITPGLTGSCERATAVLPRGESSANVQGGAIQDGGNFNFKLRTSLEAQPAGAWREPALQHAPAWQRKHAVVATLRISSANLLSQ